MVTAQSQTHQLPSRLGVTLPDSESSVLLEMYRTAVEMADRVSARRGAANSFFLTLNTALAATVGIVSAARKSVPQIAVPSFDAFGLCVTAAAGVILAVVWWALLRYYRRLSGAKWDVINALETRLPCQPFTDEWSLLHPEEQNETDKPRAPNLRLRVRHREATVVEQVVPFVFVALYLVLAIRVIVR